MSDRPVAPRDPALGAPVGAAATAIHDVAIVGFGPTGATLANLLAASGVSVIVFDREADVYHLPRAVHFDGECMRVFQAIGIADTLLPDLIIAPGMRFVDAAGRTLIDWRRPTELGPQGWHPSYRFHQPTLERQLRARLAARSNVTIATRHEVFALDVETAGDLPDGAVRIRYENLANGRLGEVRARTVVGCDGARSLVRRLLGTELDDLESHERWLVVDVVLKRPRPDLGDHSIQFCDPARPATYVRGPGQRRRWELMLMPGDDPATIMQPAAIWPLLARWIGPDDAELERPAVYTFHSVVARGWRRGPLLIAGDAAHQTPPFMGQGMCAGIRDAANLAWKLAAVLQRRAPEALLDSYESERSPHVRAFIETAVRLGGVIQTRDPAAVAARDAALASNPQAFVTPQPPLGPGWHDGDGLLTPQAVAAGGARSDDAVGYRHVLLVRPALRAAAQAALARSAGRAALPCALVVADAPALAGVLDRAGAVAALVRPDRYRFGSVAELDRLDHLLGRGLAGGFDNLPVGATVAAPAAQP